jgi:hypothetical protein
VEVEVAVVAVVAVVGPRIVDVVLRSFDVGNKAAFLERALSRYGGGSKPR